MKRTLALIFVASTAWAVSTFTISGSHVELKGSKLTVQGALAGGTIYSIAYDSDTYSGEPTGSASPIAWNMTIGSGDHRYLVVGCATDANRIVTGITVGGFSMTYATSTWRPTTSGTYLYTYYNPPSGSQSISVSFSGGTSNGVLCGAISFTGVSATNAVEASTATYNVATSITSTTSTVTSNDVLVDIVNHWGDNALAASAGTNQWAFRKQFTGNHFYTILMSTKTVTTPGTYDMSWSGIPGGTNPTDQSYIAIKPGP